MIISGSNQAASQNDQEDCKGSDQNAAAAVPDQQQLLRALNTIPKLAPIEMQEVVFGERDMQLLDLVNHPEPEDEDTPRDYQPS